MYGGRESLGCTHLPPYFILFTVKKGLPWNQKGTYKTLFCKIFIYIMNDYTQSLRNFILKTKIYCFIVSSDLKIIRSESNINIVLNLAFVMFGIKI